MVTTTSNQPQPPTYTIDGDLTVPSDTNDNIQSDVLINGNVVIEGDSNGGSSNIAVGGLTTNNGSVTIGDIAGNGSTLTVSTASFINSGLLDIEKSHGDASLIVASNFTQTSGAVYDNGSLTASSIILNGGVFEGSGDAVFGNVVNNGGVIIGGNPDRGYFRITPIMNIAGSYTQNANGVLQTDLFSQPGFTNAATELTVQGSVKLGGTLAIAVLPEPDFTLGNSAVIVAAAPGELSGTFSQISYNGVISQDGDINLGGGAHYTVSYNDAGGALTLNYIQNPISDPAVVGSGPDTINLGLSVDPYAGADHFTISVDGQQIGDVQSAVDNHADGQSQAFAIKGNFGPGVHTVSIDYLDAELFPGASKNLYVATIGENGVSAPVNATLSADGVYNFTVGQPVAPPPVTIGSGPDSITLNLSEDDWQGDAQFVVMVDGQQMGGVQTVTASHAAGQTQSFTIAGSIGGGAHSVSVQFLNDAWGGSSSEDRNLYVDSIEQGGQTYQVNQMLAHSSTATFEGVPITAENSGVSGPPVFVTAPVLGGYFDTATLIATSTPTVFDFTSGVGNDMILNFDPTKDAALFTTSQFADWSAVQANLSQTAAGAVLSLGAGHSVTFEGVSVSSLNSSNIDPIIRNGTR